MPIFSLIHALAADANGNELMYKIIEANIIQQSMCFKKESGQKKKKWKAESKMLKIHNNRNSDTAFHNLDVNNWIMNTF